MLLHLDEQSMNIALGSLVITGHYLQHVSLIRSWGGEIELAILSDHFQVGIDSVDVKTGHVFSYGISYSIPIFDSR
jgi:hypothetical protein